GFLRSQEQTASLNKSVTAAVEALSIEDRLFRDVKADVNRLFTLANTQLQVQDAAAVAQGNIALNLINVYRALGGGWQIRCRPGACADAPAHFLAPVAVEESLHLPVGGRER